MQLSSKFRSGCHGSVSRENSRLPADVTRTVLVGLAPISFLSGGNWIDLEIHAQRMKAEKQVISAQMDVTEAAEFDYLSASPSVMIDGRLFHHVYEAGSGQECLEQVLQQFDLYQQSNPQAFLCIHGSFMADQLIALLSDENAELKIHTSTAFNHSAACKLDRELMTKLRLEENGYEWGEQPLISFFRNPSDANKALDQFDEPLDDREWKIYGSPTECWLIIQTQGCINLYKNSD